MYAYACNCIFKFIQVLMCILISHFEGDELCSAVLALRGKVYVLYTMWYSLNYPNTHVISSITERHYFGEKEELVMYSEMKR